MKDPASLDMRELLQHSDPGSQIRRILIASDIIQSILIERDAMLEQWPPFLAPLDFLG